MLKLGSSEAETFKADFLRAAGSNPVLEKKEGWESGKRGIPGFQRVKCWRCLNRKASFGKRNL